MGKPHPVVNLQRCKACGLCALVCPKKNFELGDKGLKVLTRDCIGCNQCVLHCPDMVIEIKEDPTDAKA